MSSEIFLNGRVTLHAGDSRDVLKTIPDCSIDSIVTDPPYALVSIVKRFANSPRSERTENTENPYGRTGRGFMGQKWDNGETAFAVDFWAECLRVLKPGGHVVAFSGTRTYHRMACAIEDAGFEVRNMLSWNFGSGFPKSHNISKTLDDKKERCSCNPMRDLRQTNSSSAVTDQADAEVVLQPILPKQNIRGEAEAFCGEREGQEMPGQGVERGQKRGVEGRRDISQTAWELRQRPLCALPAGADLNGSDGRIRDGASACDGAMGEAPALSDRVCASFGPQAAKQSAIELGALAGQPKSQVSGAWDHCGRCGKPLVPDGLGTDLKPAHEPICLARKPLAANTIAANVLQHGTGAINIDGCRVAADDPLIRPSIERRDNQVLGKGLGAGIQIEPSGRWPANIIHDGSEEVIAAFPICDSPRANGNPNERSKGKEGMFSAGNGAPDYRDTGSAARFFYTSKADSDDRLGSKHPTVKPVDLMQWLCRLVTPKGGTVLDPFAGTGTTGEAAFREGFKAVLIEREEEYQADIRRRMALVLAGPDERARESIKAKTKDQPMDLGPLFSGAAE